MLRQPSIFGKRRRIPATPLLESSKASAQLVVEGLKEVK
jgi:hypothetical protein